MSVKNVTIKFAVLAYHLKITVLLGVILNAKLAVLMVYAVHVKMAITRI